MYVCVCVCVCVCLFVCMCMCSRERASEREREKERDPANVFCLIKRESGLLPPRPAGQSLTGSRGLYWWQSFGGFMLYEWKRGDATQAHAVPGYIYLVISLGAVASVSNALGYVGACSRSVCMLSTSLGMVLLVLLLQGALALVLFYDPSLVDTPLCPPDDEACRDRIDHIFADPSAHAGHLPCLPILHCCSAPVSLRAALRYCVAGFELARGFRKNGKYKYIYAY